MKSIEKKETDKSDDLAISSLLSFFFKEKSYNSVAVVNAEMTKGSKSTIMLYDQIGISKR